MYIVNNWLKTFNITIIIGFFILMSLSNHSKQYNSSVKIIPYDTYQVYPTELKTEDSYEIKPINYISSDYKKDLSILTETIFFEGRGEDLRGKTLIFDVIMNRLHSKLNFGDTIEEVVYKNRAFSYLNTLSKARRQEIIKKEYKTFKKIRTLAHKLLSSSTYKDYSRGAIYYFNHHLVTPDWYDDKYVTVVHGNHTFLKWHKYK